MSGFDPGWLALREPADHAARDPGLLAEAAALAGPGPLVDLGCGTGSTIRALAPHLPGPVRWRLVDADPVLLAEARRLTPFAVETVQADLRDLDALPLDGATLVTASALFDLVSLDWLERFAAKLAAARLPLYAALTYDGRSSWSPAHPRDAELTQALNDHQRTDKGLGAALGPDATAKLAGLLEAQGYRVRMAESPWRLGPDQAALQRELARGYAGAAGELGIEPGDWLSFRITAAAAGEAEVGHLDLLASLPS